MKPIVPTNLACAWCKGSGITPVDDPTWSDGKDEGATHGGCWYQVYKHPGCNEDRQWTYRIAYEPRPLDSRERNLNDV